MTDRPEPPRRRTAALAFEAHGVRIDDPWAWLRDPAYPKVEDPAVLGHLAAENALLRGGDGAARRPRRDAVRRDEGPDQGRRALGAGQGRRLVHWWAFEPGAAYRRWFRRRVEGGPDELVLDELAEAAGKDYFRLGGMAISPDRRLAGADGRRQRRRAVHAEDPRPRDRRRPRDREHGGDGRADLELRVGRRGLHRDERALAQLPGAAAPPRRAARGRRHALRGDRGRRLPGRRRALDRPQPDLPRHRRRGDEREPLRAGRRSDRAAGAGGAPARRGALRARPRAPAALGGQQRRPRQLPRSPSPTRRRPASGRR